MTPQEYIKTHIQQSGHYTLTTADQDLIDQKGIEEFIFKMLMRKPYRKWALEENLLGRIRAAIHFDAERSEPIRFGWPFGGYKLWRLPSSPEVDWAELFSISYFAEYLAPIAAAYTPGVDFVFTSDDHLLEEMSNIPKEDTDAYCASLERLLQCMRKHFPVNMRFTLQRNGMRIAENPEEYARQIQAALQEQKKKFLQQPPTIREAELHRAQLNIRWDGAKDLTNATESEKRAFIEKAPLLHDAYYLTEMSQEYYSRSGVIEVFATKFGSNIAIGTTKTSRAKFWAGFGVLEKHKHTWQPRILSPQQLAQAQDMPHEVVPMDAIPLKNFTELWVFPEPFTFHHT